MQLSMWNFLSLSPVSTIQIDHHHMLAQLSGASASSGALFRTNDTRVNPHAIVIMAPSDDNFRSLCLGFTPKACLLQKNKRSIKFPNIVVRPGDHLF